MPHTKNLILIPARMKATRLPNKPMADICGEPMIVHVWRRAMESGVGEVVVATDHVDIKAAIEKVGGRAVLTREDHPSGSDRLGEALAAIDPERKYDVIINLQGDIPTLEPHLVADVLKPLENPATDIGTLVCYIDSDDELNDPAVVKANLSRKEQGASNEVHRSSSFAPHSYLALTFSRTASVEAPHYHHIGIYAYRRAALEKFIALPPSEGEKREKLEQFRALENGIQIGATIVHTSPLGVDTLEHLEKARKIIKARTMGKKKFLQLMKYNKLWAELNMYPDELFNVQIAGYIPGRERASEHYRNGAFHWWLRHRPTKEQLKNLVQLSYVDPDEPMAEDVRKYIAKSPCCDNEILELMKS